MKKLLRTIVVTLGAIVLLIFLIGVTIYFSMTPQQRREKKYLNPFSRQVAKNDADINALEKQIRADQLYAVNDLQYKDSAVWIAVGNPEKSGTEEYFDRKYKLNSFDNINMVYVFQYDSARPLASQSPENALMAKGKKLGRFQEQWAARFINVTDGSCRPLNQFLKMDTLIPHSFDNIETTFQPESISRMKVVSKVRIKTDSGTTVISQVSALIDNNGNVLSAEKDQ